MSWVRAEHAWRVIAPLLALAALALAGLAVAPTASADSNVDLLSSANIRIDGPAYGRAGTSTASIEDLNGDGLSEVLVGAPPYGSWLGAVYVVFGQSSPTTIDLASLGDRGYRIHASQDEGFGSSVSSIPDLNGDGRSEVLIGAPNASHNGPGAGSVYVVFGKASTTSIDVANLGSNGYRIDGSSYGFTMYERAGTSVASIGDLNGDGKAEVLVYAHAHGAAGSVYVVFGKASTTNIDLGNLGVNGYRIDGLHEAIPDTHNLTSSIDDLNGDGRDEVVVSDYLAGSVYVVFGQSSPTTIDLASLGDRGYRIDLPSRYFPYAVSSIRDLNGDGKAEVLIGAPINAPSRVYVVFGKATATSIDLANLGQNGYAIVGDFNGDAGQSVSSIGDLNGDGRHEVLVGAPGTVHENYIAGSAYVVFGQSATTTIDLASLGSRGYRIDGTATIDEYAGSSVASIDDLNGDGRPEVIVGVPYARNNGRFLSGSVYVVLDSPTQPPNISYDDLESYVDEEIEPEEPEGSFSPDATFSASPPLPDGLSLNPNTGEISGTPSSVLRETHFTITATNAAGSSSAQFTITTLADEHEKVQTGNCRIRAGNSSAPNNLFIRAVEVTQGVSGKETGIFHRRRSGKTLMRPYSRTTRSRVYRWNTPFDPSYDPNPLPDGSPSPLLAPFHDEDNISSVAKEAATLVSGKPTLVRVYANTRGVTGRAPARVILRAYHQDLDGGAGTEIANSPQTVDALAPTDRTSIRRQRRNLGCSFDFLVPEAWTHGDVQLKAEVERQSGSSFSECSGCHDGANRAVVEHVP
jgi:hypothetical protein